ncbi:MAG: hypothetical protein KDD00_03675 [Ignavibacteriae bacterium]|nr:hypothetical protein [Ignavibacteriota bacterium]
MLSRKKRDAKFLIFQSLYIIAIAILFYKGTDLSLVQVIDANDSLTIIGKEDTVVNRVDFDSLLKLNAVVDYNQDSIVNRSLLAELTRRANENNTTPIVVPKTVIPQPPSAPETKNEPEKTTEKKDPKPIPTQNVTEFSNQPFTNPSADKKLLVYQDGSLIGIVEPSKTKSLRVKSGGKITYGYSD